MAIKNKMDERKESKKFLESFKTIGTADGSYRFDDISKLWGKLNNADGPN